MSKRINISIKTEDVPLLDRFDDVARAEGLSRSEFMVMAMLSLLARGTEKKAEPDSEVYGEMLADILEEDTLISPEGPDLPDWLS